MARVEGCTTGIPVLSEETQPVGGGREPKKTEGTGEPGSTRDSFEQLAPAPAKTMEAPRRAELQAQLEEINGRREELKPELSKARHEAMLQMPKLLPVRQLSSKVGPVLEHGLAAVEVGRHIGNADPEKAYQAAIAHVAKIGAEHLTTKALKEELKGIPGLEALVSATEIHQGLREYGSLVKQDEALRLQAEDIQMQLDPDAKFPLTSAGGRDYSRSAAGVMTSDGKRADWTTPLQGNRSLSEDEKYVEALRRRHGG